MHCRFNFKLPSWAAISSKDFLEHIFIQCYTSLLASSSLCSSSSALEFTAPPGLIKPKLADFKAQSKSHLFTQTWNTTGQRDWFIQKASLERSSCSSLHITMVWGGGRKWDEHKELHREAFYPVTLENSKASFSLLLFIWNFHFNRSFIYRQNPFKTTFCT